MSSRALTYTEARATVVREVLASKLVRITESVDLEDCGDRVLAQAVHADRDYPSLDRTARDGFAVRSGDLPGRLRVIGEVRAGQRFAGRVGAGEAVEIMTGAPIPEGADSIVMIEHVSREGSSVVCPDPAPVGQFINFRGGEARAGAMLLQSGTRLGTAEIALLAAVGCVRPTLFARPEVVIIATGDELVHVSENPAPHQIRNSNAPALASQVKRAGGIPRILPIAPDREAAIHQRIEDALSSDLILISGGVSAGKYDLVESVLHEQGAEFFFERVLIQPGQPLVFGCLRDRFLFGLPGNPASTVVCFEMFGRVALEILGGQEVRDPVFLQARLTRPFRHRGGLTRFLPATVSPDGQVSPVTWTGSSDIAALARANAYMVVDPDRAEWQAGETIEVFLR